MSFQGESIHDRLTLEAAATVGRAADTVLGFLSPTVLGNCILVGICHPASGQTLRAESVPASQVLHLVVTRLDSTEHTAPRGVGA